jgi:phage-related protein
MRKEFFELPIADAQELRLAMGLYQKDAGIGYDVRSYGDGLRMLKPTGGAAGRCLFFRADVVGGLEVLTVVLIYKKESQEVPAHVMDTARKRMRRS